MLSLRAFLLALALLVGFGLAAPSAQADAYEDAISRFTADSYPETEAAVAAVVASANPLAARVISALGENRLLVRTSDKAVLFREADKLLDARTGAAAEAQAADLKPVRSNNRVRRAIDAAMGALSLLAPDSKKRLEAAQAVYKSRDASALPALDAALADEKDANVKQAMQEARAAALLAAKEAGEADRLAAVETLRKRGDQDSVALMRSLPADVPASVKVRAAEAAAAIESRLAMMKSVQDVAYGLSLGSVLLLAAIGLAITFGVMGVINMAHGEMVMLGAYTTFVVQEVIRTRAPYLFDASLFIAVPLAFLVAGAAGVLIERTVIRFLYGRPLETLLATWGLSLILQQTVRSIFGPNNREVGTPSWMSGSVDVLGLALTYNRIVIFFFAMSVFAILLLALNKTPLGLQIRAVTQNRRMASSMGIRTDRIDALTFGLGSGVAGMAGVALSQIDNVSPNLGQSYIIDSFLVVVFGGVGNLWGTLVAALSLGVANKLLEPLAGAVLGKIILLIAIILFIQKRPRGMFALKGRAVQA